MVTIQKERLGSLFGYYDDVQERDGGIRRNKKRGWLVMAMFFPKRTRKMGSGQRRGGRCGRYGIQKGRKDTHSRTHGHETKQYTATLNQ